MQKINLKLLTVDSVEANYEITLDGSDAKALFSVRLDSFDGNIMDSNHFVGGVHRSVRNLQRLDVEYHPDALEAYFG